MLAATERSLDSNLNVLVNTKRLERFVLRFVAPEEHDVGREKLGRFQPLRALAEAAAYAMVRKDIAVAHPETDEHRKDVIRKAVAEGVLSARPMDWPPVVFLALYPRCCAQVISVSNGYATPEVAARIVQDGAAGRENWCEWIYSCFDRDARRCVQAALCAFGRRCERKATGFSGLKRGEQAVARALLGFELQLAAWF